MAAVDVGGVLPFGEGGGLIAEFVGDGGVQDFEQIVAFLDEAANFLGIASIFAFVLDLLLAGHADGGEVGLEIGDEVGGQVVGDEFGGDAGLGELLEEGIGRLNGLNAPLRRTRLWKAELRHGMPHSSRRHIVPQNHQHSLTQTFS